MVSEFVCRLDDAEFVTCKLVDERKGKVYNWQNILIMYKNQAKQA